MEGRGVASRPHLLPNYPVEEPMPLQLFDGYPFVRILLQQSDEHIPKLQTDQSDDLIQSILNIALLNIQLNGRDWLNLIALKRVILKP